jgi:hypothetical protein
VFEESLLISQIATATGYTVGYSVELNMDVTQLSGTLPLVYVGHLGIRPHNPNFEIQAASGFAALESEVILHTGITFCSTRANFVTNYNAIKAAYTDYSPIGDPNVSSMIFIEGSVIAATNTHIWYREIVGVIFPRIR